MKRAETSSCDLAILAAFCFSWKTDKKRSEINEKLHLLTVLSTIYLMVGSENEGKRGKGVRCVQ
jgi:hypothetical protein